MALPEQALFRPFLSYAPHQINSRDFLRNLEYLNPNLHIKDISHYLDIWGSPALLREFCDKLLILALELYVVASILQCHFKQAAFQSASYTANMQPRQEQQFQEISKSYSYSLKALISLLPEDKSFQLPSSAYLALFRLLIEAICPILL